MRLPWVGLIIVLTAGCAANQTIPLGTAPVPRPATCRAAVQVYAAETAVDSPFVRLAIVRSSSRGGAFIRASQSVMLHSLQDGAAKAGANGLIYQYLLTNSDEAAGEGVAIWIPADSSRAAAACDSVQATE